MQLEEKADFWVRKPGLKELPLEVSYLSGGLPGGFFQDLSEIGGRAEAQAATDLFNRQIGGDKQIYRFFRKDLMADLHRGFTQVLAEFKKKAAFTDPAMPSHIRNGVAVVGLHKCKGSIQLPIYLALLENCHFRKNCAQKPIQHPNRCGIDLGAFFQFPEEGDLLRGAIQLLQLQVRCRLQWDQRKTKGIEFDNAVFGCPVCTKLQPLGKEEIVPLLQMQIGLPGNDPDAARYDSAKVMIRAVLDISSIASLALV